MTHVKVDGFQEAEHVLAAAEAGVDAVGLVLVPSAHRNLSLSRAALLLEECRRSWGAGPRPEILGLFADQPAADVVEAVSQLALDSVQLCGAEGMGYCRSMPVPIYKVVGIDVSVPVSVILPTLMALLQRNSMAGHRLVLDRRETGAYGGTGRTFDWTLAARLAGSFRFSLAGGLTPENVGSAIALVRPWGVDASSGVESHGRKDPLRITSFVQAVREADERGKPQGLVRMLLRRFR